MKRKVGRPKTRPKQVIISVTLDEACYKQLNKEAAEKGMSRSALVRLLVGCRF